MKRISFNSGFRTRGRVTGDNYSSDFGGQAGWYGGIETPLPPRLLIQFDMISLIY